MKKIYQIILAFSLMAVLLAIGNFVFAQKKYFLDDGKEYYIFDKTQIYGFLNVGQNIFTQDGSFGDVLVGNDFLMDANVYFCKNEKDSKTDAPLNKNCAKKVLAWTAASLETMDDDYYKIQANQIEAEAGGLISLKALTQISTSAAVRVNGCFSNYGNNPDCAKNGELKTQNLVIKSLTPFNKYTLSPQNLIVNQLAFDEINAKQNLCKKCSQGGIIPTSPGSITAANDKDLYFKYTIKSTNTAEFPIKDWNGWIDGGKICCKLAFPNFLK